MCMVRRPGFVSQCSCCRAFLGFICTSMELDRVVIRLWFWTFSHPFRSLSAASICSDAAPRCRSQSMQCLTCPRVHVVAVSPSDYVLRCIGVGRSLSSMIFATFPNLSRTPDVDEDLLLPDFQAFFSFVEPFDPRW